MENNKGINLKELLGWNSYPSGFKFSDEEFLYDVSRKTILDYINILEEYNLKEIEEEKEIAKKEKFLNRVYNECIKVIEKTLKLDSTIEMQLYRCKRWYDISNQIGNFKVDKIVFEDNNLILA